MTTWGEVCVLQMGASVITPVSNKTGSDKYVHTDTYTIKRAIILEVIWKERSLTRFRPPALLIWEQRGVGAHHPGPPLRTSRWPLNVGLQSVHVHGTVVFVPVFSFVVRSVAVFLFLHRPDPLLQLDQTGHLRGQVVLFASRRRRLVAAVLLVLVGHHLLDADHGLGLADQRHLRLEEVGGEVRLQGTVTVLHGPEPQKLLSFSGGISLVCSESGREDTFMDKNYVAMFSFKKSAGGAQGLYYAPPQGGTRDALVSLILFNGNVGAIRQITVDSSDKVVAET